MCRCRLWLRGWVAWCAFSLSSSSRSSSPSSPAAPVRAWRTEAVSGSIDACTPQATPTYLPLRTHTQQLVKWQAARTHKARRAVAAHWAGTLLLAGFCGLDARFREAAAAVLDYYAVSALMSMALFSIVAFSDPGFLQLPPLAPAAPAVELLVEEGRAAPGAGTCGGSSSSSTSSNFPLATAAGQLRMIPVTVDEGAGWSDDDGEVSSWSFSSSSNALSNASSDTDDDTEGEEEGEETDAEVRAYTSPSRGDHGNRMRAFTVVDPLLGRADVETAERLPGVRAWLRARHCAVCGLDRLPIRCVVVLVVVMTSCRRRVVCLETPVD